MMRPEMSNDGRLRAMRNIKRLRVTRATKDSEQREAVKGSE